MARPKNKTDLIQLGRTNFEKLLFLIDGLTEAEQQREFPEGTLNRNIRDVLCHLHHWHLMILEWHKVGLTGRKPDMPAKGYTWKTTPELNRWIHQKYSTMDLASARKHFENSFRDVQSVIESYRAEELFEKKRFKWTGSTSAGSYFVSATSSHYDWAIKLIKKVFKD